MRFQSGTLIVEMNRLPKFGEYGKQFIDGKIFNAEGKELFSTNNELQVPHD